MNVYRLLFNSTADVYAETPATGAYTTSVKEGLPCRLLHIDYRAVTTSQDRATLAAERIFVWPAAEYTLPAYCQLEVNGTRWQPVEITAYERLDGPDGTTHHGRVPVRRVGEAA